MKSRKARQARQVPPSNIELRRELGECTQARMALRDSLQSTSEVACRALGAIFAIARAKKGELWETVGDIAGEALERLR
jgi:hypothetical protein